MSTKERKVVLNRRRDERVVKRYRSARRPDYREVLPAATQYTALSTQRASAVSSYNSRITQVIGADILSLVAVVTWLLLILRQQLQTQTDEILMIWSLVGLHIIAACAFSFHFVAEEVMRRTVNSVEYYTQKIVAVEGATDSETGVAIFSAQEYLTSSGRASVKLHRYLAYILTGCMITWGALDCVIVLVYLTKTGVFSWFR